MTPTGPGTDARQHPAGDTGRPNTRRRNLARSATRPLWRGTAFLRAVTFLFAAGTMGVYFGEYARPHLALVVVGVMGAWTVFNVVVYLRQVPWLHWVVVADVVLSCGLMCTSLLILTPLQFAQSVPLITTVWVAATPVAAGLIGGRWAGAGVGLLVAVLNGVCRNDVNTDVTRDGVLLVGAGLLVGLAARYASAASERLAIALRTEATTAERERLARSIHDSVLQVLARIRKQGTELGGQAAELAELAGEQEIALRTLIASTPAEPVPAGDGTQDDLRARLQGLAGPRVVVSVPPVEVPLPVHVVDELAAVVAEALANVARHAGEHARAWVLLEDLGTDVVISVRDDGVGIPEGRLTAALQEGRLGVVQSIRARITELGGTVSLDTAPDEGTEWEFHLPRVPVHPRRGPAEPRRLRRRGADTER